jgi:hypothetical protein
MAAAALVRRSLVFRETPHVPEAHTAWEGDGASHWTQREATDHGRTTRVFVLARGRCTTLSEAAKLMWMSRCRSLLVLDDAGQLVDMVTDLDLLTASARPNQKTCELTVSEILSHPSARRRGAIRVA